MPSEKRECGSNATAYSERYKASFPPLNYRQNVMTIFQTLRRQRNKEFITPDGKIEKITGCDLDILNYIVIDCMNGKAENFPDQKTIGERIGCCRTKVSEALNKFKRLRCITFDKLFFCLV